MTNKRSNTSYMTITPIICSLNNPQVQSCLKLHRNRYGFGYITEEIREKQVLHKEA